MTEPEAAPEHGTAPPNHGKTYTICGAKKRQAPYGPCTRPAGWGTPHVGHGACKLHGGSTANHRAAAEVAIVETKAREVFGQLVEVRPIDNPLAVFADFAGRVMAWMNTIDGLIEKLTSPTSTSLLMGEEIRGEVILFERAMDRANTVLATYAKLNIDERLSRITEAQQHMVLQAIEAALASADVTGARATVAKKAAARRLRLVS